MFFPSLSLAVFSNGVISSGRSSLWSVWRVFRCLQVKEAGQVPISHTLNCFTAQNSSPEVPVFELDRLSVYLSLPFSSHTCHSNVSKPSATWTPFSWAAAPSSLSPLPTWPGAPLRADPHASISLTAPILREQPSSSTDPDKSLSVEVKWDHPGREDLGLQDTPYAISSAKLSVTGCKKCPRPFSWWGARETVVRGNRLPGFGSWLRHLGLWSWVSCTHSLDESVLCSFLLGLYLTVFCEDSVS